MATALDGYDIIGDLHGQIGPLQALLKRLGYSGQVDGGWHYPAGRRQAVFVGDFVDRNPHALEVIAVVRQMVEAGEALAVMGNHEFNALAWHTADPQAPDTYLRRHSERNRVQHAAFLQEAERDPEGYAAALDWFRKLPMWLDLGMLRVAHATWLPDSLRALQALRDADGRWSNGFLVRASRHDDAAFDAVEATLKGLEVDLPAGVSYLDNDGRQRYRTRLRWWLHEPPATLRGALMAGPAALQQVGDAAWTAPWPAECGYPADAPPVFCGHYWLDGPCAPLAENVACVDYSAAHPGNKLVAYRWNGESRLSAAGFVAVRT
ncbi:MAG TPA: metallophosphoesterase [Nevskiaceae bacterium]|nr:metallophosphoesterase [Nevskiaceae bacterium]